MAPAKRTTKAPATKRLSRLHSMAFGTAAYVSRRRLPFAAQDSLPGAGQALLDRLFTCKVPLKGFQLTSCVSSSFPKLLGTIAVSRLRDRLLVRFRHAERQEKPWLVGDGGPALAGRTLRVRLSHFLVHLLPCSRAPLFLQPPERPCHCGRTGVSLPNVMSPLFSRAF